MKNSSITLLIMLSSLIGFSQDITGKWSGNIEVGEDKKINFIFSIVKNDSSYKTTLDIPSQRVTGIQAVTTHLEKEDLVIDVSNIGMMYKGHYDIKNEQIEGTVTEGANSFPLILNKRIVPTVSIKKRPQEPTEPYSYLMEEVSFENVNAGITLAGTLTTPNKKGPFPVVILISGSGPQDRDETIAGHKPFLVLADHLTQQGLAVLRYDDRGFGGSTGSHPEATTYDFALDVMSAIAYLKSRKDIDQKNIGLIGHSEGGIIAPLVANKSKDVAFIVSLAGTGISGVELSVMQSKALRPFPVPDEKAYERAIRRAIEIASADKDISVIKEELRYHYYNTTVPIIKNLGVSDVKIDQMITGIIDIRTSKWIRYFYQYNPADEYEKISCPVLSINGSKDKQVDAKVNQEGIRKALEKSKNKDFKIVELSNLNHLFQECKTGEMDEYNSIEQTFAPIALEEVSKWVLAHVKK